MLLTYSPFTNPINAWDWAFPLLECIHIVSFACSIGMVVLVDLRLLGLAFRQQTPGTFVKSTNIFSAAGFAVALVSGLLLFSTDPLHYYHNAAFRFKITCLIVAVIFNFTIHAALALRAPSSSAATRLAGAVSLLLWVCVVFGGVYYSFY